MINNLVSKGYSNFRFFGFSEMINEHIKTKNYEASIIVEGQFTKKHVVTI